MQALLERSSSGFSSPSHPSTKFRCSTYFFALKHLVPWNSELARDMKCSSRTFICLNVFRVKDTIYSTQGGDCRSVNNKIGFRSN